MPGPFIIKGVTGCFVNGRGVLADYAERQYVSILVDKDPRGAIENGLRVFFEASHQQAMEPHENPGRRGHMGFWTEPAPGCSNGDVNVLYAQFKTRYHGNDHKIYKTKGDLKTKGDGYPRYASYNQSIYITQIIVEDGFQVTEVGSNPAWYWLHVPAPAVPGGYDHPGQIPAGLYGGPALTGQYRVLIDPTGLYGRENGNRGWFWPDSNMGMQSGRNFYDPSDAKNWLTKQKFGVAPNKGTVFQLPVYRKYNGDNSVWKESHEEYAEEKKLITFWGRTGQVPPSEGSGTRWRFGMGASTHNDADQGIIFFHDQVTGKHPVPKPSTCLPNVAFVKDAYQTSDIGWPTDYTFNTPMVDTGPKSEVLLNINSVGNYEQSVYNLLVEVPITDKFGIERVFYVPAPYLKSGDDPNNPYRTTELGGMQGITHKCDFVFPIPRAFDPYAKGYFPSDSGEYLGSQATKDLPFIPANETEVIRTREYNRLAIWAIGEACMGGKISKGQSGQYSSCEYLQPILTGSSPTAVTPSQIGLAGDRGARININGNFVKWFKRQSGEFVEVPEIDTYGTVTSLGEKIPQVCLAPHPAPRSGIDLARWWKPLDQLIEVDQIEIDQDGNLSGVAEQHTTEVLQAFDVSIHSKLRSVDYGTIYNLGLNPTTQELVRSGALYVTNTPDEFLDVSGFTPTTVVSKENKFFYINGSIYLDDLRSVTLNPVEGTDDPNETVVLGQSQFTVVDQPRPGRIKCKLPGWCGPVGLKERRIKEIEGLFDVTIMSDQGGWVTIPEAITLKKANPAHPPEIKTVEPSQGIDGKETVTITSANPGDITAETVCRVYLGAEGPGGVKIYDPLIRGDSGPGVFNYVKDGKIVGITFVPTHNPRLGPGDSPSIKYDLKIRTKVDPFDSDSDIRDLENQTILSTYLEAYTILPPTAPLLPVSSQDFPFRDPTGIFVGSSPPVDPGENFVPIVGTISGMQFLSTSSAEYNNLENAYALSGKNIPRNSVGLDKIIEDPYVHKNVLTENLATDSSPSMVDEATGVIPGTTVHYNLDDPSDAPAGNPLIPVILCTITNQSRLSNINMASTPPFIREDLLIIPDEQIDPYNITKTDGTKGGYYSYLAGFNFDVLDNDQLLIIQNFNSEEDNNKFGLKKLVARDGSNTFDDLNTLEIPPGHYAVHDSGYYLAMNLLGVFGEYKIIRGALVYFGIEEDLEKPEETGGEVLYESSGLGPVENGYGGLLGENLTSAVRHGFSLATDTLTADSIWAYGNPNRPTLRIPGRDRYILVIHDSLVDDYLYPGTGVITHPKSLGAKEYAPSEIILNSNLDRSVSLLPSLDLPLIRD